jgi:peptidoglycan/LPS O-acetylase OafA/YrhL
MFQISIQQQSNLSENYYHSTAISLLRGLAALEVAAAHLRAQVYPGFSTIPNPTLWFKGLAFATGFAHLAVVVFFVLSGWLVGGSLLNKFDRTGAIREYAIDRMTRLWIVLIPTFLLILLLGAGTGAVAVGDISFAASNEYSVAAFFGNLIGLQNILVPNFGGNFPLWSLSNETWYYMMFPMFVTLFSTRSTAIRVVITIVLAGIVQVVSNTILMYFAIWLMGAGCSRLRIECSRAGRLFLLLGFLSAAVYIRLTGQTNDLNEDSFLQDLVFSVAFLAFLSSIQVQIKTSIMWLAFLRRAAKFFANFSFTLYVLHIPLIAMMMHMVRGIFQDGKLSPFSISHAAVYGGMFLLIVAASFLFYLPFESNTQRVRSAIKPFAIGRRTARQPE